MLLMRFCCLFSGQYQGVESYQWLGKFQERMTQHFMSCGSPVHVHLEGFVQEILKYRRQLVPVLDLGLAIGGDQIERSEWVLVEVGRLPLDHLDGHDAEGPHVHLGPVVLPGDHLGRHPVRGPHHRGPLVLLAGDLGAEAEVGELDLALHAEQDVVRLDVAMEHVLRVHLEEAQRCHIQAVLAKVLGVVRVVSLDDRCEGATVHEL